MARGARKYPIPQFLLDQGIDQEKYGRWIDKVVNAITRRDSKRLKTKLIRMTFRAAVHRAVCSGGDRDFYTGERLNWKLLQHFNGEAIPDRKHHEVPSVDHEVVHGTIPVFRICSLRTNKCKSDYRTHELIDFCKVFLAYQEKVNDRHL